MNPLMLAQVIKLLWTPRKARPRPLNSRFREQLCGTGAWLYVLNLSCYLSSRLSHTIARKNHPRSRWPPIMSFSQEEVRKWNIQHNTDLEQEFAHLEPEPNPPISRGVRPPAIDPEHHDRMLRQRQMEEQSRQLEALAIQQRQHEARAAAPTTATLLSDDEMMMQLLAMSRKNKPPYRTIVPPVDRNKFIEWLAGAGINTDTSNEGTNAQEWINMLSDVRSQPGCEALAQSGVENDSKIIVIGTLLSMVILFRSLC